MKVNIYFHLVRKYRTSGALPPLHGLSMNNFTNLDVNWFFCDSAEHYLNFQVSSRTVSSAKTHIDFFGIITPLCLLIDIYFHYRSEHNTLNTTHSFVSFHHQIELQ